MVIAGGTAVAVLDEHGTATIRAELLQYVVGGGIADDPVGTALILIEIVTNTDCYNDFCFNDFCGNGYCALVGCGSNVPCGS